jgi:hypothetical protein
MTALEYWHGASREVQGFDILRNKSDMHALLLPNDVTIHIVHHRASGKSGWALSDVNVDSTSSIQHETVHQDEGAMQSHDESSI